jgi:mRNA interferase MazF
MKYFTKWIRVKENIDTRNPEPPLVDERDVWWASVGENVGTEINGKSSLFTRPVIILKKLTRKTFLCIPTTSKQHEGTWYVKIRLGEKEMYACLHQIRVLDYKRFYSRIGQLDTRNFSRVREGFVNLYLYKNIPPPLQAEVAANAE